MSKRIRVRRLDKKTVAARKIARRHARRPAHHHLAPPQTNDRPSTHSADRPLPAESHAGGHRPALAAVVSILLGLTAAMVVTGLCTRFETAFGADPAIDDMVVAGALFALALGVRVPQRFANWVSLLAWRRFLSRGRPTQVSALLISTGSDNRSWHWIALSVIALAAGVTTGLLPLTARLSLRGYAWMQSHFVWSQIPLVILRTATVLLAGLVPLAALGLATSVAHRVSCRHGKWETTSSAYLLFGAGLGVLVSGILAGISGQVDLLLTAAALPALVVSLIAAGSCTTLLETPAPQAGAETAGLPIWRDRRPMLLRTGIVAVGAGAVWVVAVGSRLSNLHSNVLVPSMFISMGLGLLNGCRARRAGLRSIGGFGVVCAVVGMIVALVMVSLPQTFVRLPGAVVILLCVSSAALGFATGYGRQTLLQRVASRSSTGAAVLANVLTCGAVVVWVAAPIAVDFAGKTASFTVLALFMLALGGMLIIHEPKCSWRTRHIRLGGVCLAITLTALLGLYPRDTRQGEPAGAGQLHSKTAIHSPGSSHAGLANDR